MKKRFLSLGLREKIQFLFLCTMIVCILFCSGIFYLILENQMQQSIADKEISNRTAISNNLDSTMKSINSISRLTMLRSTVRTFLLAESNSTPRTRNALQEIHDILNTFNLSCNVVILRMDGQYLNTGPGITYVNTDKIFEIEWLDEVMAQKGNYVIKAGTRDAFRSNIGEMVSFVRVINDINTQKPIGILAINLPSRFFEQAYEGLSGETSHFALYDASGRLICKDNESTFSSLKSTSKHARRNGQTILQKYIYLRHIGRLSFHPCFPSGSTDFRRAPCQITGRFDHRRFYTSRIYVADQYLYCQKCHLPDPAFGRQHGRSAKRLAAPR